MGGKGEREGGREGGREKEREGGWGMNGCGWVDEWRERGRRWREGGREEGGGGREGGREGPIMGCTNTRGTQMFPLPGTTCHYTKGKPRFLAAARPIQRTSVQRVGAEQTLQLQSGLAASDQKSIQKGVLTVLLWQFGVQEALYSSCR